MKSRLLDRTSGEGYLMNVSYNKYPNFLKVWHHHPELELVLIIKSSGTHFIGDNFDRFKPGDIVLIGKNLPHMWLNDSNYFLANSNKVAEAISIHFEHKFLGSELMDSIELKKINKLLTLSKRGIKFSNTSKELKNSIKELTELSKFERLIHFILILQNLASLDAHKILSSTGFNDYYSQPENGRLEKIYDYLYGGFKSQLTSRDVANHVGMNASAFSRYFKKIHRKSFTKYLNEMRVGHACKLLFEERYSITEIAYESGFNNLSYFNRTFKTITGLTPSKYLKIHPQN